ncbi:DNA-processing protein DprA [Xanthobacter flavus]
MEMLRERGSDIGRDVTVFYAGDIHLLDGPAVSIVGTRDVSDEGRRRALKLARGLTNNGVTVVSGLAKGVDTAAHMGALESGATVAVIGTPLSKAYPAENAHLQEEIYTRHLLLSPFAEGATVFKGNFPARNRVMAAVTDATVIIEASDTSGTLHQAAECQRLGRTLFILQSVLDDPSLSWPSRFIGKPNVEVLRTVDDVLKRVSA